MFTFSQFIEFEDTLQIIGIQSATQTTRVQIHKGGIGLAPSHPPTNNHIIEENINLES